MFQKQEKHDARAPPAPGQLVLGGGASSSREGWQERGAAGAACGLVSLRNWGHHPGEHCVLPTAQAGPGGARRAAVALGLSSLTFQKGPLGRFLG